MKSGYKIILSFCIGLCFIFAGIALGGLEEVSFGGVISGTNWRWNPSSIDDVNYQANNQTSELDIQVFNGQVQFIETSLDYIEVKASDVYEGFEIYQDNNKLVVQQSHSWNLFKNYESAKIDIYVPRNKVLDKIKLSGAAGQLKVYDMKASYIDANVGAANLKFEDVVCDDLKVDVGMGNATGKHVTCANDIKVNVGMGNAKIELTGEEREYSYKMNVGLGSIKVGSEKVNVLGTSQSSRGTTQKMIRASCGLGVIKIEMEGL